MQIQLNSPDGTIFQGVRNGDVDVFRGICYGRYERFCEAHEEVPSGVVDATRPGSVCPQRSSRLSAILGQEVSVKVEEGRLCLSIYAPAAPQGKLPVMVWIHGGAFLSGGSEEPRYGCERLVRTGGVVVVKISYRLGAFGYLYLPERGIVNLGLKDQQLAISWIRHNIAAFGGDPDNITLFGQSAGAQSIAALLATSGPQPQFRRAVLQSAPLGLQMRPKYASHIARAFMRRLGKDIMTASIDEMLDAQEAVLSKTGLSFAPVLQDVMALPEGLQGGGLSIVLGHTAQDVSPFVWKMLGPLYGSPIGRALVSRGTRVVFSAPEDAYAKRLKAAGVDVARYLISWHPAGNPLGACHCIELPFLLGCEEDWTRATMLQGMRTEEFQAHSSLMLKAWTQFAATGEFTFPGL